MKMNNDHMYHGAALTQIAEHPEFTAIKTIKNCDRFILHRGNPRIGASPG